MFQLSDIPRILPEILLLVLALLVLLSDVFERWARTPAAQLERTRAAASLSSIGLGLVLAITLLQSGYIYRMADDTPANFLTNILRNLQAGGPAAQPIGGVFAADDLTMIARLTLIGAALLTSLLCLDFRPAAHPAEFYAMLLFSTAGMCLMAAANELILAFLALELASIPLYILAGYFRSDTRSAEAGMKYFLFGALSSGILLYGMSLAYGFAASTAAGGAGTNDLTQLPRIAALAAETASAGESTALLTLALVFIVAGLGYKLAVVPFHAWSPDVYQGAPAPVTAFIATASKTAGFILLFRMLAVGFPELTGRVAPGAGLGGWTSLLALLALLTLVVGNLAALPQTNARRLLAYSSIAQAGFLLLGLVAWAAPQSYDRQQGTAALLYYLVVYTLTNLGAFGALAAVLLAVGGDEIRDLNGLARRNLGLAVAFAVCVLSLAGVPPLAGFFAKFYIFMVAWQSGARWLVVVAIGSTVVSLYYYLRLLKAMFITPPDDETPVATPRGIGAALLLAAVGLLALGVFPNVILGVISRVQLAAAGL